MITELLESTAVEGQKFEVVHQGVRYHKHDGVTEVYADEIQKSGNFHRKIGEARNIVEFVKVVNDDIKTR